MVLRQIGGGWEGNPQQPDIVLPALDIVDQVDPPASLDAVYYSISPSRTGTVVLEELLENRVELLQTWAPTQQTLCDCATCVNAIIVELTSPDERIRE